jgi:hypothetical protein
VSPRVMGLGAALALLLGAPAGDRTTSAQDVVAPVDAFFSEEVWAKVGERTCLNCHTGRGEAAESEFLLRETELDPAALAHNREAFGRMAAARKDGTSKILLKVGGGIKHGGGTPFKPGSTGYRILETFVKRLGEKASSTAHVPPPFFQGVEMAAPARLLRRAALSLAGRLPRPGELEGGLDAAIDGLLKEDAFYDRLKEGFNDILLAKGYPGNADDALSYDHFEKTRHWYQKHDLSHVPEKERTKAGYKLADDYRAALLREPYELIAYIVRNDRPFTEIATADYFMVSPYTSRGYGIFDQVKDQFKNVDDPFEYVPARLPALKGRNGKTQENGGTGIYPHAGILSLFQYLRRYPTTVTNRNRLRARMYYRHFLGVDVMALAPRVTDAAAVGAKFANPTLQAPDCVVCHRTIDPVAGLFQDYFNEEGHFGPRKEGWFTDMFGPGLEGRELPAAERWRALQWLGQETAKDPRFAVAMVEHVYYLLMGRPPLLPPVDIDDPHFTAKRRAYLELRKEVRDIAARFAKDKFNLKTVFKAWIASPFYRVDGLSKAPETAARRAELDDVGIVHMLTPEQVERKVLAVFGRRWGRLDSDGESRYGILYGGIDSKSVTERAADPSGAMGALQRIMANDVACKNVPADFAQEASKRRLFPDVELDDLPGTPEGDAKIRKAIVHLHERLHGRAPAEEVERTWRLFTGILEDAKAAKGLEKTESYYCRAAKEEKRSPDPHYTLRAWRGVVTYLLRQDDFLYE